MENYKNTETRIFVKILFSEIGKSAMANVHYYRNQMTVDFFQRWKWYFEYRAALLRIKYPKAFIKYETGPYEYSLPIDIYKKKVKDTYLSDKRQLTKFQNKLNAINKNWNELFPIEEHPDYIKVKVKLAYYELRAQKSKKEYNQVFSNDH